MFIKTGGHRWGNVLPGVIGLLAIAAMLFGTAAPLPLPGTSTVSAADTYGKIRTFAGPDGRLIDEIIIDGKPPDVKAPAAEVPYGKLSLGANPMTGVPAFNWSYGCSATSAAMLFGYYDRTGYANMYTGPTNGGVMPLTNTTWGAGIGGSTGQCPLSATRNGMDGRTSRGAVDDYWIAYGSTAQDPYVTNGWVEHALGGCTGDYMGTNQYRWGNTDGSTTFFFYNSGNPLYDPSDALVGTRDGGHGLRLFAESRGYTVVSNFNQYIQGRAPGSSSNGFTFANYMTQIDAGRPVLIHVNGHTMLGYGYNTTGQIVYLHDTWDNADHQMTWGGTYSGLQHYGVSVFQLAAAPPVSAPTITNSTGASSIATTSAHLNGELTATGGENPTVHLYWGTADGATTPGNWAHDVNLGVLPAGTFSTNLTGLTGSTTYYYRAYAVNSAGGSWASSSATFSTVTPPHAPTVTNGSGATFVVDTSARLYGIVTDTGGEGCTRHIFWGTTDGGTTAGNWAHDVNLGTRDAGAFYTDLSGLVASTTYYYRAYAVNSGGGSWAGSSVTFTTTATSIRLIGVDAATPASGAYPGNYFFLYRFQATGTGNVTTFKLNASGPGNVKAALYADASGEPGALLGVNHDDTPVTAGWNNIYLTPTSATTVVQAGTYYWLAYFSDAAIGNYQTAPGTLRYRLNYWSSPLSFAFPDPAGSDFNSMTNTTGLLAGWGFPPTPVPPTVTNAAASNIGPYAARLNGSLSDTGYAATTVHVYWGTSDGGTTAGNWGHDVNLGALGTGAFSTDISSLSASTTYYFRAYAVNSAGGTWAGSTLSFTTAAPPSAPTVANAAAGNIADTSARLNGNLTATGGENPVVHVYWGPTDGGTTAGNWAHDANLGLQSSGAFFTDITGLTSSTIYFYRAYAVNSGGGTWAGSSATFTTAATPIKLLGVDAATPASGAYPGNYFFLYRFQATGTGNVTTFKLNASGTGNVKAALYADAAGEPGRQQHLHPGGGGLEQPHPRLHPGGDRQLVLAGLFRRRGHRQLPGGGGDAALQEQYLCLLYLPRPGRQRLQFHVHQHRAGGRLGLPAHPGASHRRQRRRLQYRALCRPPQRQPLRHRLRRHHRPPLLGHRRRRHHRGQLGP
jgi:hypothetical protein